MNIQILRITEMKKGKKVLAEGYRMARSFIVKNKVWLKW